MLEVFAIPYFAVSALIGWAIFAPFFKHADVDGLTRSRLLTVDLMAVFVPVGGLFAFVQWVMPTYGRQMAVQAVVIFGALALAAMSLMTGLFLVPNHRPISFAHRMIVVGIVAPAGLLLTFAWVAMLAWASTYSVMYLVPATIAIASATAGLRLVGLWVCREASGGTSTKPAKATTSWTR